LFFAWRWCTVEECANTCPGDTCKQKACRRRKKEVKESR